MLHAWNFASRKLCSRHEFWKKKKTAIRPKVKRPRHGDDPKRRDRSQITPRRYEQTQQNKSTHDQWLGAVVHTYVPIAGARQRKESAMRILSWKHQISQPKASPAYRSHHHPWFATFAFLPLSALPSSALSKLQVRASAWLASLKSLWAQLPASSGQLSLPL